MMPKLLASLQIGLVSFIMTSATLAAEAPVAVDKPLIVGLHHSPPFSVKNADGSWSGLSAELWSRVASELKIPFEFKESSTDELNDPEKAGIDVVPGFAISLYSEERVDMTAPYLVSGLAIATRPETKGALSGIVDKILSTKFLKSLGILGLVMLIMGTIVWRIERQQSPTEFGGSVFRGISAGIVWTVESLFGKGKSLSRTPAARAFALSWTAVCVLIISGVTATLASELTVNKMSNIVNGPNDLPKVRVGTVRKPSVGATYLDRRGIAYQGYDTTDLAMAALARGDVDAIVSGELMMKYLAATKYDSQLTVLPGTFQNAGTGFALRKGSPLRKAINLSVLKITESDEWSQTVARHLAAENAKVAH